MRERLAYLLRQCPQCNTKYADNVALVTNEEGHLTEEQITSVYKYLMSQHLRHTGV